MTDAERRQLYLQELDTIVEQTVDALEQLRPRFERYGMLVDAFKRTFHPHESPVFIPKNHATFATLGDWIRSLTSGAPGRRL